MKKVSLVFNIVLLILVGILFYLHFSPNPAVSHNDKQSKKEDAKTSVLQIAYVNVDSLEAHYSYFKDKKAELDKKQQSIQNELKAKSNAIQKDIAKLQKEAPTLTQSQGEAAQKKIIQKRQQLQQREQQLRTEFMQEQQAFNNTLHARLNQFLKQYNGDKKYTYILSYSSSLSDILYKDESYDITADVISGMNKEAAASNSK